jgi:uncharacterized protein YegL
VNQNLCEIGFVLDRSGSMESMAKEAIGGFNGFLESHRKAPGDAKLTLVLFDHEYIVAHDGRPMKDVPKLDESSYQPRGTTALLDAIGRTINAIGQRLDHTPESNRPSKVLIVILTDGLENASKEFSLKQILEMIKHQREVYSWEFIFLGAGQDAIQTAARIGIASANAVQFDETPQGVCAAFSAIAVSSAAYRGGAADYAKHLTKAAKKGKA